MILFGFLIVFFSFSAVLEKSLERKTVLEKQKSIR